MWADFVPGLGTIKSFRKNGLSLGTIGSALGDIVTATGLGAGVGLAAKAGNYAVKAGKVSNTASRVKKLKAARELHHNQPPYQRFGYQDKASQAAYNLDQNVANDLIDKSIYADGAANAYNDAKWAVNTGLGSGSSARMGIKD